MAIHDAARLSALLAMLARAATGCASHHASSLQSAKEREITVGIVQREIRVGMSQADVAEALGSPNIVSTDSVGKEVWIYDKIATEASYSRSSVGGLFGGGGTPGTSLILGGIRGSHDSGAAGQTQRTLTVVIRFAQNRSVESFSYHTSRF